MKIILVCNMLSRQATQNNVNMSENVAAHAHANARMHGIVMWNVREVMVDSEVRSHGEL